MIAESVQEHVPGVSEEFEVVFDDGKAMAVFLTRPPEHRRATT